MVQVMGVRADGAHAPMMLSCGHVEASERSGFSRVIVVLTDVSKVQSRKRLQCALRGRHIRTTVCCYDNGFFLT